MSEEKKPFPELPANFPQKLLSPYNPAETEARIYKIWEDSGFFNPDVCVEKGVTAPDAKSFTIIMPPPNVTGILHMGHASMLALQDTMIRFHRMRGDRTLWIPGTDHAAIATQSKVEGIIKKTEDKSRHDLGREAFLERVRAFAQDSHDTIVSQVKAMGSSCDWSREAFTLDDTRTHAVRTMFKKMYEDGLIYRGMRIVNWDPKGQTTVADDEIVYEERSAKLYTFKYSKDFPISISTTRPETKVGDTAVAVHPTDERYKEFVGKTYEIADFCGVPLTIKVIADDAVEKDFGTGALGVTPAHSMIDWEIADRHDLPKKQVINEYAKMMVGDERILNKKTTVARDEIVKWLGEQGLLEKEEDVKQNIGKGDRTEGIIEPLPKLQWFINVNKEIPGRGKTLKEIMREPVASGAIKIIPDYFDKTYFHWIDNLRDWCISRQIWYGHRIPIWYKNKDQENQEISTDEQTGEGWVQDEDTLDTWFSSGMWSFSTLGWPNKTKDLEVFHPTDVLETGYEILFAWVARMIMMAGYGLETIPFHTVYLHGTVRAADGRKMSKSLGNGINPLDVARDYGADAGRMALMVGASPGLDSKISYDKIKGYKNFANKLWNITRFVLSSTSIELLAKPTTLSEKDTVILAESDAFFAEMTKEIEEYHFHIAAEKLYHYVWHTFADIIIEESKPILAAGDESRAWLLQELLRRSLIGLHPFMPHITEELWSIIPREKGTLLIATKWFSTKASKQS
jgi:valyl-tRNA synthetase